MRLRWISSLLCKCLKLPFIDPSTSYMPSACWSLLGRTHPRVHLGTMQSAVANPILICTRDYAKLCSSWSLLLLFSLLPESFSLLMKTCLLLFYTVLLNVWARVSCWTLCVPIPLSVQGILLIGSREFKTGALLHLVFLHVPGSELSCLEVKASVLPGAITGHVETFRYSSV